MLAPVIARHTAVLRLAAEETPTPVPTPSSSTTPEPSDGPTTTVQQTVEAVAETTVNMITLAWRAGIGAAAGVVVAFILIMALRFVGRRQAFCAELARFCRNALYATGALIGAYLGAQVALIDLTSTTWADIVSHTLLLSAIAAFTWLVARFLYAVASTVIKGAQAGGDAGRANRVTTQTQILRRVAVVIVTICGIVGMVMTFPAARFAMTSLLASAGLVSVVAGLAAQSTLGNVFAGLQLAATDAIRVDDVVEVKDWNGQIEEITLTYVVVRLWDERRLILPSTYFTQNPFTNWTRRSHQLTGSLTLELDWRVPVSRLRTELDRILSTTTLWDGRTSCASRSSTGCSARPPTPCPAPAWRSSRSRSPTTPSPSRWRRWPRRSCAAASRPRPRRPWPRPRRARRTRRTRPRAVNRSGRSPGCCAGPAGSGTGSCFAAPALAPAQARALAPAQILPPPEARAAGVPGSGSGRRAVPGACTRLAPPVPAGPP